MPIDIREAEPRSLLATTGDASPPCVVEAGSLDPAASDRRLAPGEVRWHVLHTKARQEKAIARALHAADIEHYLPLVSRVRYRSRRKRQVEEPLFASYLFLRGPLEAAYFAVATKRVANIINVIDQDRFVNELEQIRRALHHGAALRPDRYLEVGRRVRVTAGPFRDIEGRIEHRARPDRLVLQIAALGRATSLEIDADLLEGVD
ncbi:MAG: transcription termination/antitermination NusG family protein [Planctomycetota bacterium]|nr:transcription termination/antitermination NusG family protein [Planctomycetota bacterium]